MVPNVSMYAVLSLQQRGKKIKEEKSICNDRFLEAREMEQIYLYIYIEKK